MRTNIFYIAIAIFFITVQTLCSGEYEQLKITEIKTIQTVVKLPDGKSQIINRQIRVPNNSEMNNTFKVEKFIKYNGKLELKISSKIKNDIFVASLKNDCSSILSSLKISLDSLQNTTIVLEVNEIDPVILLFTTEKGEKLIKKLF